MSDYKNCQWCGASYYWDYESTMVNYNAAKSKGLDYDTYKKYCSRKCYHSATNIQEKPKQSQDQYTTSKGIPTREPRRKENQEDDGFLPLFFLPIILFIFWIISSIVAFFYNMCVYIISGSFSLGSVIILIVCSFILYQFYFKKPGQ